MVSGIYLGAVYGLICLGIVMIYKATHIFNFAQGYMLMVGVLLSWVLINNTPLWVALPVVVALAIILGFLIHRFTIRPLIGQPLLASILVTLGVAYFLEGLAVTFWGTKIYPYPQWFPVERFDWGIITIHSAVLWGVLATAAIFGLIGLFYWRSRMGKEMRATAEDHEVAQSLGIRVDRVFTLCWVVAAVLVFIGAVFFAVQSGAFHGLSEWGWKAIPGAIVGGLDSVKGAIVGGLIVGMLEVMCTGYVNPAIGGIAPFIVLLLVLIIKPYGIFGEIRIERL